MVPIATPANASTRYAQAETTPSTIAPAATKVIYVNPELGTDTSGAGASEAAAYKTITFALTQAEPGTVIQLAPGNYTSETGETFPLTLKSGVTLRGDEATKGEKVVINGGGEYISPTFARQNVAIRAEKETTISGVTVTNTNTRGTGLWIESANPIVTNSTFANSNRDGIFITGTASPKIEANQFIKNGGNGISVARAAQGEIRNNVFQSTGFGLAIGGTSSPLVSDNQIQQNKDGIYVSEAARPILRNNVIQNNDRDGVVATVNAQPDIGSVDNAGQNLIRGNKRYDLYNATRSNAIVAIGNDIDPKRISGKVDFTPAQIALRDIKGLWAQPYIEALATQNIIAGFPDGTFRPNEPVTRAQFAAIVSKAFAPKAQRPAVNFQDVNRKFWGYQAIQIAYQGGFVAGYPGNLFEPEQKIPRVQALVSLANGLNLSADNPGAIAVYTDAAQIPNYATQPVAAATQQQLVINYPTPTQLNPNREATRAEVAAFVYQALVNAGRAKAIPSPYLVRMP
jgi:parallel beta-helix repeat protein